MKSFIRGLWGNNGKIVEDISNCKDNIPYTVYCYGKDNYKHVIDLNRKDVNAILLNDDPILYDHNNNRYKCYRYKLDILQAGTSDYNEIIYLDWDCNVKEYQDVWQEMSKSQVISGCLYWWGKEICNWRSLRYYRHFLINTGFLYLRDKEMAKAFINEYNINPHWDDEVPIHRVIDKRFGFKGKRWWYNYFEPKCCKLMINAVFDKEYPTFIHAEARYSRNLNRSTTI